MKQVLAFGHSGNKCGAGIGVHDSQSWSAVHEELDAVDAVKSGPSERRSEACEEVSIETLNGTAKAASASRTVECDGSITPAMGTANKGSQSSQCERGYLFDKSKSF
ncbi:hypothetical protein AYO47_06515 [Planctomyces sp. SCGC AG-212-M04]|nr:hypothetical protein AYO47_06515 [Planctomyces sp. SCGC AG-212-M04]